MSTLTCRTHDETSIPLNARCVTRCIPSRTFRLEFPQCKWFERTLDQAPQITASATGVTHSLQPACREEASLTPVRGPSLDGRFPGDNAAACCGIADGKWAEVGGDSGTKVCSIRFRHPESPRVLLQEFVFACPVVACPVSEICACRLAKMVP